MKKFAFRSHICSSCVYQNRDLRRVCWYLGLDSAKWLAHAHWCLGATTIAIHYSQERQTRSSSNFSITGINWSVLWQSHHHLLPLFHCCVFFPGWQWYSEETLKICLLTYKTLCERQPVYLQTMLSTSLPSHSLRSHKGIILSVSTVKTNADAKGILFLRPFPMEQPPANLSIWLPQLQPSGNIWKCMSLIWPFHHKHQHTLRPGDILDCF